MEENRRTQGSSAEEFVCEYLSRNGFRVLDRNFYMRGGELDIVAVKDDTLAFVEVRSWNRQMWPDGTPLETISFAKIKHIVKTARFYIQKKGIDLTKWFVRFDVAALIKSKDGYTMNYIENAFDAGDVS